MIGRKNMGRASPLLLVLLVLGFFFATYNFLTIIIPYRSVGKWVGDNSNGGLLSDPIIGMPENVKKFKNSKSPFHVALTATDAPYSKWQCRIMYYWYKKNKDLPGSEMGGFTRILHSGNPDNLMDEIPTMVVDPLPAGLDRGYIVLNRPWAFDQWLFEYIQGKNKYREKIEMTAPVLSEVSPSDGPFCESSFVVSFYVPKKNQENPPPAEGLHVQKWKTTYVAVRQFSGFVSDDSVGEEAAALKASLAGTVWSAAIEKSHAADHTSVYTVNLREHNEEQVMLLC